jgi:hypothetical protein
MQRYLCTDVEMESSFVQWPFSSRGNIWFGSLTLVVLIILVIAFEACDQTKACYSSSWVQHIWGEEITENGYCERDRTHRFMEEHANSLSNLAFCAVGSVPIACGVADAYRPLYRSKSITKHFRRNHLVEFPLFSVLCGLSWWLMGIMSFSFHAHRTRLTQQLDVGSMYITMAPSTIYWLLFFLDINSSSSILLYARSFVVILDILMGALMTYYKWSLNSTYVILAMLEIASASMLVC